MLTVTKRVNILKNGTRFEGIVMGVPDTLQELLRNASRKLEFEAKVIYNEHGCVLDDIRLICNDDKLYIAGTEPFIPVVTNTSQANAPVHWLNIWSEMSVRAKKIFVEYTWNYLCHMPELAFKFYQGYLAGRKAEIAVASNEEGLDGPNLSLQTGVDVVPAQDELPLKSVALPTSSKTISFEFSSSKPYTNVDAPNETVVETLTNPAGDVPCKIQQDMVKLNVGGQHFCTSRTTLLKDPESMLAKMFSNDLPICPSSVDQSGAYFIDRSPVYFEPILNYLRDGTLIIDNVSPDAVFNEAKFYCIESLVTNWSELAAKYYNSLTRMDIVKALYTVHMSNEKTELQFQHANLRGVDLSGLKMRCVDFSFACFQWCRMVGTGFYDCILAYANFDGADLRNVVFDKINGKSFQRISFRDANMCGAKFQYISSLKDIDFGGANLKNVSLIQLQSIKKCNFKTAVCKDMNLNNKCTFNMCDFSGIDFKSIHFRASGNSIRNSKLISADFDGIHLGALSIVNCDLTRAKFRGGTLLNTSLFEHANLRGADLSGANMAGCTFDSCFFEDECFSKINVFLGNNFENADFTGADLRGSAFILCCLIGVTLTGANLERITTDNEEVKQLLVQMAQ